MHPSRYEIMTKTYSEMIETEILIQTEPIPSCGCRIILESLGRKYANAVPLKTLRSETEDKKIEA